MAAYPSAFTTGAAGWPAVVIHVAADEPVVLIDPRGGEHPVAMSALQGLDGMPGHPTQLEPLLAARVMETPGARTVTNAEDDLVTYVVLGPPRHQLTCVVQEAGVAILPVGCRLRTPLRDAALPEPVSPQEHHVVGPHEGDAIDPLTLERPAVREVLIGAPPPTPEPSTGATEPARAAPAPRMDEQRDE